MASSPVPAVDRGWLCPRSHHGWRMTPSLVQPWLEDGSVLGPSCGWRMAPSLVPPWPEDGSVPIPAMAGEWLRPQSQYSRRMAPSLVPPWLEDGSVQPCPSLTSPPPPPRRLSSLSSLGDSPSERRSPGHHRQPSDSSETTGRFSCPLLRFSHTPGLRLVPCPPRELGDVLPPASVLAAPLGMGLLCPFAAPKGRAGPFLGSPAGPGMMLRLLFPPSAGSPGHPVFRRRGPSREGFVGCGWISRALGVRLQRGWLRRLCAGLWLGNAVPETESGRGGGPHKPSRRSRLGISLLFPPLPPQVWSSAASSSRRTSMASASPSAGTASSWCSRCGQVRGVGAGWGQGGGRRCLGAPPHPTQSHIPREKTWDKRGFPSEALPVWGLAVARMGRTRLLGEGRCFWGRGGGCFGEAPQNCRALPVPRTRRGAADGGQGIPFCRPWVNRDPAAGCSWRCAAGDAAGFAG